MGVRTALDDFGTGYSGLSYLRRFTFAKVKIDKSFVPVRAHDHGVRLILAAIRGLCRNLDLPVVSEGVATTQQIALLQQAHCAELQGFLLGRPTPAVAEFLLLRQGLAPGGGNAAAAVTGPIGVLGFRTVRNRRLNQILALVNSIFNYLIAW